MYAVIKKVLEVREGLSLGSVRAPLSGLAPEDMPQVRRCADMIDRAITAYAS